MRSADGPPRGNAAAGDWRHRGRLFALLALALTVPLLAYIAIRRLGRRPLVGVRAKLTGEVPLEVRDGSAGRVLLHGVSLGEVALMRPLVPALEQALGRNCLLTTTTDTGWQGLAKHFPEHPRAFLPFDLPWAVERFLSRTRPAAVVLLEAEFWPVWLCACFRRGIPVALVNARVSPRSFARFRRLTALVSPLFAVYAAALAQNGTYAARLRALGCAGAKPTGSLKADMIRLADGPAIAALALRTGLPAGRPMLLLASTSAGEEETLLTAWAGNATDWCLVICPRHPERGAELERLCRHRGRTAVRSAAGGTLAADSDAVLIVDEIGCLGALYGWCAQENGIAAVGGSFGSGRGGQNMLEAAAARCATVVGWDVRNQPDSMHLLRAAAGVVETTPATLPGVLAELAADPVRRRALGAGGHAAWLAGQGAAVRTVAALRASLAPRLGTVPTGRRP